MLRRIAQALPLPQLQQQLSAPAAAAAAAGAGAGGSTLWPPQLLRWAGTCQQQGGLCQQQHQQHQHQHQQRRALSTRLSPKQQKRDAKRERRDRKKAGAAGDAGAPAGGDGGGAFAEEAAAAEADMTRLVLQAIANVTPLLDVRSVRTATKVSYVPGLMPPRKARSLALHWLVKAADARAKAAKGAKYAECLALELLLAYQKRGAARQKRDDIHKLALQNRANVHMRWW